MCALVRNDVFFFRLLSGAALAHRTRRNAGDGVPYEIKHVGTPDPGCPPPLGGVDPDRNIKNSPPA